MKMKKFFMMGAFVIATITYASSALARNQFETFWYSNEVRDQLRTGESFTVVYKGEGSIFHKGTEVTIEVQPTAGEGDRTCHRVYVKGNGHNFREFKENLESLMDDKDGFVSSLYHRQGHPNSLETVLCEEPEPNTLKTFKQPTIQKSNPAAGEDSNPS